MLYFIYFRGKKTDLLTSCILAAPAHLKPFITMVTSSSHLLMTS